MGAFCQLVIHCWPYAPAPIINWISKINSIFRMKQNSMKMDIQFNDLKIVTFCIYTKLLATDQRGIKGTENHAKKLIIDLVDIPPLLSQLLPLKRSDPLFNLSLIFNCHTFLLPPNDPSRDSQIMDLYHQNVEERASNTGDSQTGRHLYGHF